MAALRRRIAAFRSPSRSLQRLLDAPDGATGADLDGLVLTSKTQYVSAVLILGFTVVISVVVVALDLTEPPTDLFVPVFFLVLDVVVAVFVHRWFVRPRVTVTASELVIVNPIRQYRLARPDIAYFFQGVQDLSLTTVAGKRIELYALQTNLGPWSGPTSIGARVVERLNTLLDRTTPHIVPPRRRTQDLPRWVWPVVAVGVLGLKVLVHSLLH